MCPTKTTQRVRLLAALVDIDDQEDNEYRFLVDGKHVKYVTMDPGSLAGIDASFEPDLLSVLPEFPPGDWTESYVARDTLSNKLVFSSTSTAQLPAVQSTWHPTVIDHLELQEVDRIRQNIQVVSHALFPEPVAFKFAPFPWQVAYLEAETKAYEWIQGAGIGPKFLGHVAEDGRVIGFLFEHIRGASMAELKDLDACSQALARLHSLGVKHGDVNRNNFLIKEGKVTIIDFEMARQCSDQEQLRVELMGLEESFKDPSDLDGVIQES